jgi:hypothetical protein
MTMIENGFDPLENFMDEEPTIRCGEGGCNRCDAAFHASCDPILPVSSGVPEPVDEWEGDTEPDYASLFLEISELGGEG